MFKIKMEVSSHINISVKIEFNPFHLVQNARKRRSNANSTSSDPPNLDDGPAPPSATQALAVEIPSASSPAATPGKVIQHNFFCSMQILQMKNEPCTG